MTHQVRISRRAHRDLQSIYDRIAREAPRRADTFIDDLYDVIESLQAMPRRGARPRDPILRDRGYRFLVHGDFLIFYAMAGKTVRVRRVVRGSRATRSML